jgi:ParB family chromosome partitioning protein
MPLTYRDEGTLSRLLSKLTLLQAAASSNESSKTLREAAEFYKVDVGAITTKVKQEFATKNKAKAAKTVPPKPTAKKTKKPIAA